MFGVLILVMAGELRLHHLEARRGIKIQRIILRKIFEAGYPS